jgi:hypothetical protein
MRAGLGALTVVSSGPPTLESDYQSAQEADMRRTPVIAAILAVAAAAAVGGGVAVAAGGDDDASDTPITGTALERATAAALAHTGGGEVTGTEVGDEESRYEVEVTLENGNQVDVQLDDAFAVVGAEGDDGEKDD